MVEVVPVVVPVVHAPVVPVVPVVLVPVVVPVVSVVPVVLWCRSYPSVVCGGICRARGARACSSSRGACACGTRRTCRTRGGICRTRGARASGQLAWPEFVAMSEVGLSCRLINHDRLRAIVAEGDLILIPTVACRSGGIPPGSRACGCRSAGGISRTRGGARRFRGAGSGARRIRRTRCARARCGAGSSRGAGGISRSRCRSCGGACRIVVLGVAGSSHGPSVSP